MSAVDVIPEIRGVAAAGEFVAPRRSRRLAGAVLVWVLALVGLHLLSRPGFHAFGATLPLFAFLTALMGYLVRTARLRVDHGGVRWGWDGVGFRVAAERLVAVRAYRDALCVVPRRGRPWYLVRRDWEPFEALPEAFTRTGVTLERLDRRAPLGARLQGYGIALDGILVATASLATLGFLL